MDTTFPGLEKIWAWQERLNGFGPRLTGSTAQADFINFLRSQLSEFGLSVSADRLTLTRWEAKSSSLDMLERDTPPVPLPVTSSFPYSGETSADGVSGEIVTYSAAPWFWTRAHGKIAVVDVRIPAVPRFLLGLVLRPRSGSLRSHGFPAHFKSPLLALIRAPNLAAATEAGVRAVICVWRGCSGENAAYQYLPFTRPYQGCPALWVDAQTGDRLRELAGRGGSCRLRLEAEHAPGTSTETLFAVLPGIDEREAIIINTHTDGPNACEENGVVGLLALAQYFTSMPREHRRRTLVFAFVTGHFQLPQLGSGGQATRTWLKAHPELWDGRPGHMKAVAGITLEHLGAMEWKDDERLHYAPTGRPEAELVYAANDTLDRIYSDALAGRTMARSVTLRPMSDIYLGEGQPLFQAKIPTLSLIAIPDYLCAAIPVAGAAECPATGGGIQRLDPQMLYEQIVTFRKVVEAVDKAPTADLLRRESEPGPLLQALVRLFGASQLA